MKKYKTAVLLSAFSLLLSSCGSIKGEYIRISAPSGMFSSASDTVVSSAISDVADVSSDISSDIPNYALKNDELVRVSDYIKDVKVDLKYATADNFTNGKIYDFDDAYLRYGTVKKLMSAAENLRKEGYRLLIWDAYRPHSAQFTLFENAPDDSYVSDPNKGYTSHSSGATVDISLVKADGSAVTMPTGFDDFSAKADRDYGDVSTEAAANAKLLEKAMTDVGFRGYSKEWWHYSDTDTYDFENIKSVRPVSKTKSSYTPDCDEYISLRKSPDSDSEIICKIPVGAVLKPFSWYGKFVGVVYGENVGYVYASYVK